MIKNRVGLVAMVLLNRYTLQCYVVDKSHRVALFRYLIKIIVGNCFKM